MMPKSARPVDRPTMPRAQAWKEVALTVAALWLVLGLCCFGVGVQWVYDTYGPSLEGAFVLDLIFGLGCALIIAFVYWRQHRVGEGIAELGWNNPVRIPVLIIALIYGALWTALSYQNTKGDPFEWMWQRPIMMMVAFVIGFGEEVAVRGLILDRLERCGTSRVGQILFTALVMGCYHGIQGLSGIAVFYIVFSAVLFGIVSAIYVFGGRSLKVVFIAHAMTHFFGDPSLIQGILVGMQYT